MPEPATDQDFARIKLLVLDVDGVLTDGGVYYDAEGVNLMRFSIVDGLGMVILQRAGIEIAILTTSANPIIAKRAERLGVKYLKPGVYKKGDALPALVKEAGVAMDEVAYLSDDINDVAALRQVGLPMAVPKAMDEVKALARYVTTAQGGDGAVREVCNRIVRAKGLDPVELWEQGE